MQLNASQPTFDTQKVNPRVVRNELQGWLHTATNVLTCPYCTPCLFHVWHECCKRTSLKEQNQWGRSWFFPDGLAGRRVFPPAVTCTQPNNRCWRSYFGTFWINFFGMKKMGTCGVWYQRKEQLSNKPTKVIVMLLLGPYSESTQQK